MQAAMKILQLCNKLPYPEKDGGAIAINTLTHSLTEAGCEVKMLAMNTTRHLTNISSIPLEFRKKTNLETVTVDTRVKAHKALWALITGQSYNISRFYSVQFRNLLESILKKESFDIIQLEGLYLTPYIPYIRKLTSAKIVLRAHNVEHTIWEKLASESKGLKKIYLAKLAKMLKTYEISVINKCDSITVFTQTDKKQFLEMGCRIAIEVFPFGINLNRYVPTARPKPSTLFFIGALDWMPNIQGLEWFLNKVWGKIHQSFPAAEFHVAGRNMPSYLKEASYPNVRFHGEVEDAISFMKDYSIMISPLFAGGGIRVKIIEGMALGKAIISTTISAQGIDCTPGKEMLITDNPEEFYQTVKRCLESAGFVNNISVNARNYVEAHYNVRIITDNLLQFYNRLLSEPSK